MLRFKAIFFFLVFTLSSFGRSVQVHYCHGELTDTAIFGGVTCVCTDEVEVEPVLHCHEEKKSHCDHEMDDKSSESLTGEKECCKTAVIQLIKSPDFQSQNTVLSPLIFLAAYFNPAFFFDVQPTNYAFANYTAPLIVTDLSIRLQTFLI